ncbi:MAG: Plug domain-containing protein [Zoogloeaceae bacterium]|nr:Plug domain-containing protein [Zoogloeaceae bacterium]
MVVRSRNRLERLQDVPLSVSTVSGAELERLQAKDLSAITKRAANVNWNPGNPRQYSLSIRGIGKQGQTDAQDPSVGIIVDGINYAYNPMISSVDFTDIDAVEVTRGPQGTLHGRPLRLLYFHPDTFCCDAVGKHQQQGGRAVEPEQERLFLFGRQARLEGPPSIA